jgi:Flp pilus assembly pilin Flp
VEVIKMLKKILFDQRGTTTVEILVALAAVAAIAAGVSSQLLPSVRDLFLRMQDGVKGVNEMGF